jgi:hypothetical protein
MLYNKRLIGISFLLFLLSFNVSFAATIASTDYTDLEISMSPDVEASYAGISESGDTTDAYAFVTWNDQGTKSYGFQHDFEGVLVLKEDLTDTQKASGLTVGDWGDDYVVLGNPDGTLPDYPTAAAAD